MLVLGVVGTKGGTGKTTVAANLAAVYADMGYRVLMVDTDPRPSLSGYFQIKHRSEYGLVNALRNQAVTAACISQTIFPNLDIVCSDDADAAMQVWLGGELESHHYLRFALSTPPVEENYDIVVIDTGGTVGALQNTATLASDQLIIPVVPATLGVREFISGTKALIKKYEPNPSFRGRIGQIKAVFNQVSNTRDCKEIIAGLHENFFALDGRVTMMKTEIPRSVAYTEAATRRLPAHMHERNRKGGTMLDAYTTLHSLAKEIVPGLSDLAGQGEIPDSYTEPNLKADNNG
jgi:chromosome partitioning related protein ParA